MVALLYCKPPQEMLFNHQVLSICRCIRGLFHMSSLSSHIPPFLISSFNLPSRDTTYSANKYTYTHLLFTL